MSEDLTTVRPFQLGALDMDPRAIVTVSEDNTERGRAQEAYVRARSGGGLSLRIRPSASR